MSHLISKKKCSVNECKISDLRMKNWLAQERGTAIMDTYQ